jgi:hypothetical protein
MFPAAKVRVADPYTPLHLGVQSRNEAGTKLEDSMKRVLCLGLLMLLCACADEGGSDGGGNGSNGPAIDLSVLSLSLGSTTAGTPGTPTTYVVSAAELTADLVVTAPAGVEIREVGGAYAGTVALTPNGAGAIAPTTLEARIASSAAVGQAFAPLTHVSAAASANLPLSGTVTPPPGITLSTASLSLGSTTPAAPGSTVTYTVSATGLSADLDVTAPTDVELRAVGGNFGPTLSLTPDGAGNIATTTIEIRIIAGAAVGAGNDTVTHDSGASQQPLTVQWNVTAVPVDAWTQPAGMNPIPQLIDPLKRYGHGLVWLGTGTAARMVLWGGITISFTDPAVNIARVYDPATDQFEDPNTFAPNLQNGNGAPSNRHGMVCVAAGDKLFVWGGANGVNSTTFDDGGVYDYATDTWLSGTGASEHENFRTSGSAGAPAQRAYACAVWTGPTTNKILIWGGYEISFSNPGDKSNGSIYDIATDTWSSMSSAGAPSPRNNPICGFINGRLFVYSGTDVNGQIYSDGGVYDLALDQWVSGSGAANFERLRTGTGAPANAPRAGAACAVISGQLYAWAGASSGTGLNDGWVYDPATDTFPARTNLNAGTNAPAPRYATAGCTDGTYFFVFGGTEPNIGPGIYNNGGIYEP